MNLSTPSAIRWSASRKKLPDGAVVAETVGAGYTFQGKLLRPALVRLREAECTGEPKPAPDETADDELPL